MSPSPADDSNIANGALYKWLVFILPTFVRDPFSDDPSLNVQELREAVGKSPETVYKWLRKNRLTTSNAKRIYSLSHSAENQKVLASLGRTPPVIRDFDRFVYGA